MTRKELKAELKTYLPQLEDQGNGRLSAYLGSVLALDPCGKYHDLLSPNGPLSDCERYWQTLTSVACELGCTIETGENDSCDIYLTCSGGKEG